MSMRFVLLAWMPFLGCMNDEAIDQDAVLLDERMVAYSNGTWIHRDGHLYDVYVDEDGNYRQDQVD